MVRRVFLISTGALVLAFVLGATITSAAPAGNGRTITVVERAETDAVIDLGAPGDSLGDLLAFGNDIYDGSNTRKIGRDEGSCIRTNPGLAWECTWTTILGSNSLTVEGPFYDDLHDSVLAITGGTGAYWNARGQMKLHARNAAGTEFDFIFRIIR